MFKAAFVLGSVILAGILPARSATDELASVTRGTDERASDPW